MWVTLLPPLQVLPQPLQVLPLSPDAVAAPARAFPERPVVEVSRPPLELLVLRLLPAWLVLSALQSTALLWAVLPPLLAARLVLVVCLMVLTLVMPQLLVARLLLAVRLTATS